MNTNKTSFSAIVQLPKSHGNSELQVNVELDTDIEHLTYDEVLNAIDAKVDTIANNGSCDYPYDEYPSIIDIVINEDGESYPVISDSMDDTELKKCNGLKKYLVLPEAVYSLTPECELWMKLKDEGLIDPDSKFDFDKYHRLLSN